MNELNLPAEGLREKYGNKLFTVGVNIEVDDFDTQRKEYLFRKPTTVSYDRYVKMMSNSATKAGKDFVLDNVIDEQREQLTADLEEYPALAMTVTDKLFSMLGLAKSVDVKKFYRSLTFKCLQSFCQTACSKYVSEVVIMICQLAVTTVSTRFRGVCTRAGGRKSPLFSRTQRTLK